MKSDRQMNAFFLQVLAVLLLYAIWSRSVVGVSIGDVKFIKCYYCHEKMTHVSNISTTNCSSAEKNCNISTHFCGAFTNLTEQHTIYFQGCFPHPVCSDTSVGCPGTNCHVACCREDLCNNYLSNSTNIFQLITNYFLTTNPTKKSNTLPSKSPADKNPSVTKSPSSGTRNTCPFTWMPVLLLWILVAIPSFIKI